MSKSLAGTLAELVFNKRRKINYHDISKCVKIIEGHIYQDVLHNFNVEIGSNYNPHHIVKSKLYTLADWLHSKYWEDKDDLHEGFEFVSNVIEDIENSIEKRRLRTKLVIYVFGISSNIEFIIPPMNYYFTSGLFSDIVTEEFEQCKVKFLLKAVEGKGFPSFYTRLSVFFYLLYCCGSSTLNNLLKQFFDTAKYSAQMNCSHDIKKNDDWLSQLPSSPKHYDIIREEILTGKIESFTPQTFFFL